MTHSIAEVVASLDQGRLKQHDLLSFRREVGAPFRLHPLGFIVCTLLAEGRKRLRMHFWPTVGGVPQSPSCQIHNHIFEFRSWILSGAVESIEYTEDEHGKEFALYRAEYIDDLSLLIRSKETMRLKEHHRVQYTMGMNYRLACDVLHETTRLGTASALSVLVTEDISGVAPIVAGPADGANRYVYRRAVLEDTVVEGMFAGT